MFIFLVQQYQLGLEYDKKEFEPSGNWVVGKNTISGLKYRLEEIMGVPVDIIHAPISEDALITIGKVVPIYES